MTNQLKFTKSHEWVKFISETKIQIGLSDHAQEAMGDLVFVNLPQVDDMVVAGESFADVESVKAVSDIFSPVSGVITAVNEDLLDTPESINQAPYESWLIEVSEAIDFETLLTKEEYDQFLAEEV